MKLLGSTKSKVTKDKNCENVLHLEINEVVLVHCKIGNNDKQKDSRVLYTFVPKNHLVVQKLISFLKHLIQNFELLKYGLLIKIVNH